MGGLVNHFLSVLFCVFEAPGQFSLPAFPGPLLLFHPEPLDGGEIDGPSVAGHDRNRHAPVESQGFALKLPLRKHPEPSDRVFFFRFRKTIVRGEGDEPSSRFDRDQERGGTAIRGMGLEGQNPEREFLCSENQSFELRLVVAPKAEEFGGDPDRLPFVFSLEDGSFGQPKEKNVQPPVSSEPPRYGVSGREPPGARGCPVR